MICRKEMCGVSELFMTNEIMLSLFLFLERRSFPFTELSFGSPQIRPWRLRVLICVLTDFIENMK